MAGARNALATALEVPIPAGAVLSVPVAATAWAIVKVWDRRDPALEAKGAGLPAHTKKPRDA